MNPKCGVKNTKRSRRAAIGGTMLVLWLAMAVVICWGPLTLKKVPFAIPETSYHTLDEILSHPQPVSLRTFTTGTMKTSLSGIMNLEHELARDIEDGEITIPVIVGLIQHQEFGTHLIDAGLDASYVDKPYGSMRGVFVDGFLGQGTLEPNMHIAAQLDAENIQIESVFLTHLHFDHTAGILELPKNIPYITGKGEFYANFRFFLHGDHLANIDKLYEIDFSEGVDLPPLGKGVDVFGDGSFWAISSSGHSKGHVLFLINGIEGQYLFTGDACNNQYQFDMGIGPGTFSSDTEQAQVSLESIIAFNGQYPEVTLVYGHDRPEL